MATTDLPLDSPFGYYQASNASYATLHALATVNWVSAAGGGSALAQHDYDPAVYYISRALIVVDLTGLSAPIYIASATLMCPYTSLWATHQSFYATLVNGAGIYNEANDFGLFRLRTIPLGELLIPIQVYSNGNNCEIPLNSAGLLQLTAAVGSTTTFGIRIDEEINAIAPGLVNERQNFGPWVSGGAHDVAFVRIVYTANPPIALALPATLITKQSSKLNGKIVDDGGATCEYRFRYREVSGGPSYTITDWANSKETDDEFSEDIGGLTSPGQYEFAAQAKKAAGEGPWSASLYFVTLSPRDVVKVVDGVTLEFIHRMEMAGMGKFYINAEGEAVYKSRFARAG